MRLTLRELKGLPVVTVLGRPVGRVVDVELDPHTLRVAAFRVRPKTALPGLLGGELIIAERQVVRLTREALVVDDATAGLRQQQAAQPDAPAAA